MEGCAGIYKIMFGTPQEIIDEERNYLDSLKRDFIKDMKVGMRVKTIKGNGVIKSIIEDIHCSVNVILYNGNNVNIPLCDFTDYGLTINLDYE